MTFIAVILTAFGLAMDAFAVSVASGIAMREIRVRHAIRIAISFGLFQAIMPLIGWFAGRGFSDLVEDIDHWIAFGLLLAIGAKMIYESTKLEKAEKKRNILRFHVLLFLSIATSMDALAVGLTFAFLKVAVLLPVVVIGLVTFLLSLAGIYIGDTFGHFFERKIEAFGGIVLIIIGAKILITHLMGCP